MYCVVLHGGDGVREYMSGPPGPPGVPGPPGGGSVESVDDLASRVIAYIQSESRQTNILSKALHI